PRHVGLRQDAARWVDDLHRVAGLLHLELRLVLPRQVDVADLLLHERDGRAARAQVEYGGLRVELLYEVERLRVRAALVLHVAPGGEEGELTIAGRLRVRGHDLDAGLHDVRPVVDAFRVALADHEDDGRGVGQRLVREAFRPVRRHEPGLGDLVRIAPQRERDDVGVEAVHYRARLRAGPAVRLPDGDLRVLRREGGVDGPVELARGIVRDVQQLDCGGGRGREREHGERVG